MAGSDADPSGGYISVYNEHENEVVGISQTAPDELGIGGSHGLINIYDKYGEDFRSYGHEGY